jgi:FSR family fosmidomycin resistance protein-like MFS transporter
MGFPASTVNTTRQSPAVPLLLLISATHLLNDLLQAVLPSLYPTLKSQYALSYGQVGALTLVFHLIGAVGQPLVGFCADRRPYPWLLPTAMLCMGAGVLLLSQARGFTALVAVAALLGLGSSIFHPEASRACRQVAGGRFGLAQSVFQLGGNIGSALAPLLIVALLTGWSTAGVAWLALLAALGWWLLRYAARRIERQPAPELSQHVNVQTLPRRTWLTAMALLSAMILSKYAYLAVMANYYSFYLIERFALSVTQAQVQIGVFLAAVAIGTLLGGPLGDRIGQRRVILLSLLGSCPFTLLLPYASLSATVALSSVIGLLMASAFPAMIVYAQQLLPNRVGLVAGYFFGLTFGVSGMAAAALGLLADAYGIQPLFQIVAFLPLLGLLALGLR